MIKLYDDLREWYDISLYYKGDWDCNGVIYVPELSPWMGYTRSDFIALCGGDATLGEKLFDICCWEHPETVLDQDDYENDPEFPGIPDDYVKISRQLEAGAGIDGETESEWVEINGAFDAHC